MDHKTFFDQSPDVKALFEFNSTRTSPAHDGYRPHHAVTDGYLTTGTHRCEGVQIVPADGTARGTITIPTACGWAKKSRSRKVIASSGMPPS